MLNEIKIYHTPILVEEVFSFLNLSDNHVFLDASIGEGGHSFAYFQKLKKFKYFIAIDQDKDILNRAFHRLSELIDPKNSFFFHGNFSELPSLMKKIQLKEIDRAFYDLGVSMYHFKVNSRGFHFNDSLSLSMKLNSLSENKDAYFIINHWSEKSLANLFYYYGEEHRSRFFARKILEARRIQKIESAESLALLFPKKKTYFKNKFQKHPATLIFQALRIYVNQEYQHIKEGLINLIYYLAINGRAVVLTFHSMEDRIVKQIFHFFSSSLLLYEDLAFELNIKKNYFKDPIIRKLNKKVLTPSQEEKKENPSSRSTKMRAIEKIASIDDESWKIRLLFFEKYWASKNHFFEDPDIL